MKELLKESAKLIIDRQPHPERWAEGDKNKAFDIAYKLGLRKQSKSCGACSLKVVNYLRAHIGYPVVIQEEPNYKKRLEICKGCKHLSLGINCDLCKCFVHLKVRFKNQQCPDKLW